MTRASGLRHRRRMRLAACAAALQSPAVMVSLTGLRCAAWQTVNGQVTISHVRVTKAVHQASRSPASAKG